MLAGGEGGASAVLTGDAFVGAGRGALLSVARWLRFFLRRRGVLSGCVRSWSVMAAGVLASGARGPLGPRRACGCAFEWFVRERACAFRERVDSGVIFS
jgi:hypothetical protein